MSCNVNGGHRVLEGPQLLLILTDTDTWDCLCRDGPVPDWPREIVKLNEGPCPLDRQLHAPPPVVPVAVKQEPGTFSTMMMELDNDPELHVYHVLPIPSLSRNKHIVWRWHYTSDTCWQWDMRLLSCWAPELKLSF